MRDVVINGKRYGADEVSPLGSYCSRYSMSDPRYYEETLYCTQTGEYFLLGRGGAQSKYANLAGVGSAIIPLTLEETFAWSDGDGDIFAFNGPTEQKRETTKEIDSHERNCY